jgi:hypothetical protein
MKPSRRSRKSKGRRSCKMILNLEAVPSNLGEENPRRF